MSSKRKKNKWSWKRAFIYLRYILPIAFCVIALCTMLVTCVQYSTVEGHNDPLSSAELFSNSWEQVRSYLFSGGDTEPKQEQFAWVMLSWLIGTAVLYAVGLVSTVATAVCALRYVAYPDDDDKIRLGFITVVPNRVVVCILQALTLPLLFLTRIIIPMYGIMDVDVLMNTSAPEPWVWGLIMYGVSVVTSIVSSAFEKRLGLDVFKKRVVIKKAAMAFDDEEDGEEEYASLFSGGDGDEAAQRAKEDQAERIRRLLNKNENND